MCTSRADVTSGARASFALTDRCRSGSRPIIALRGSGRASGRSSSVLHVAGRQQRGGARGLPARPPPERHPPAVALVARVARDVTAMNIEDAGPAMTHALAFVAMPPQSVVVLGLDLGLRERAGAAGCPWVPALAAAAGPDARPGLAAGRMIARGSSPSAVILGGLGADTGRCRRRRHRGTHPGRAEIESPLRAVDRARRWSGRRRIRHGRRSRPPSILRPTARPTDWSPASLLAGLISAGRRCHVAAERPPRRAAAVVAGRSGLAWLGRLLAPPNGHHELPSSAGPGSPPPPPGASPHRRRAARPGSAGLRRHRRLPGPLAGTARLTTSAGRGLGRRLLAAPPARPRRTPHASARRRRRVAVVPGRWRVVRRPSLATRVLVVLRTERSTAASRRTPSWTDRRSSSSSSWRSSDDLAARRLRRRAARISWTTVRVSGECPLECSIGRPGNASSTRWAEEPACARIIVAANTTARRGGTLGLGQSLVHVASTLAPASSAGIVRGPRFRCQRFGVTSARTRRSGGQAGAASISRRRRST